MTTDTPTPAADADAGLVEVTQADRDAAADIYRRFRYGATVDIQAKIRREIERGQSDDDPIVQVFARRRLATTPPSPDSAVREADAELLMDAAGTLSRCGYGVDADEVRAVAKRMFQGATPPAVGGEDGR